MDETAIDCAYDELQQESKDLAQSVEGLASKLQLAISRGDLAARGWLLELKQVALDVRAEQMQIHQLLDVIHQYVADVHAQQQAAAQQGQRYARPLGPGSGGTGSLLSSRFARAMETGAGFAIGEDVINKLF